MDIFLSSASCYKKEMYLMKTKRLIAAILAVVMCLSAMALLSSCGNSKKDDAGITVQIGPNPETLDPALNNAVDGGNMLITLYETLLIIDEDNKVQPGQAEKYTVSDDGLTWTFTMRDGLKWSDGTELNAKDFEYTFKRLTNTELAAPYAETVIGMVEGYQDAIGNPDEDGKPTTTPDPDKLNVVASEDGKTLTVKLAYPCSYFDKIVAFGTMSPVQKATVEANGDSWATKPDTYVCNGPYMITEWTPGERIVCKKNPNYKGGWDSKRIVNNKLTFLLLENSSASFTAYNSGEAQLIKDVPTEEIPTLKKAADGGEFYVDTNLGTYYLSMNLNKAPFNNKNVRKALNLAIDRDYIANTIMQGFPTITYSTNDAGYHKAVAEYLQSAYAQLGITMKIDIVEWSSFTPQRRAGNYDMARNGWVMDYNDASNMLELFVSTNGNNDGKYNSSAFDADIANSKVADSAAHFAALHKAEKTMMEDYACIPVAYYNDFWLQKPELKGVWHSPYGYWYLRYGRFLYA